MTIILTEFRQESNSFSPFTSDIEYWSSGWVLTPEEAMETLPRQNCAIAGMKQVTDTSAHRVVFGPAYYSQSGGTAEQTVMERFLAELRNVLLTVEDLKAVFFSFHGALQTTEFDDAEAEVVRRVRELVGEDVVIVASTDLHGYISRDLMRQLDAITGYHTYPHEDFVDTGRRAARLGLRKLEDRTSVVTAWAPVPMMVSASGYDTLQGPFRELIKQGQELVESGEILDFSVYQMQPWLDVEDPTSAVVVSAQTSDIAAARAEELAQMLYAHRGQFAPELAKVEDVIEQIGRGETARPAILVDSADSPNAGAPGDSMFIPHTIMTATSSSASEISLLSVVVDRPAASALFDSGVGATIDLSLGATIDPLATSMTGTCYVKSLHDGHFRNEHAGSAGAESFLGRAAVLQLASGRLRLTLVVCEQLVSPGDPQLYRGVGLEPTHYDAVVVKANTSFKAAYKSFAGDVFMLDTPGAATPNIRRAPFTRLPETIYPWIDQPFSPLAEVLR